MSIPFHFYFKKFIAINSSNLENLEKSSLPVHGELKKVIGWQPLYNIAKNDSDIKSQKTVFLKLFKNNLLKSLNTPQYQATTKDQTNSTRFKTQFIF